MLLETDHLKKMASSSTHTAAHQKTWGGVQSSSFQRLTSLLSNTSGQSNALGGSEGGSFKAGSFNSRISSGHHSTVSHLTSGIPRAISRRASARSVAGSVVSGVGGAIYKATIPLLPPSCCLSLPIPSFPSTFLLLRGQFRPAAPATASSPAVLSLALFRAQTGQELNHGQTYKAMTLPDEYVTFAIAGRAPPRPQVRLRLASLCFLSLSPSLSLSLPPLSSLSFSLTAPALLHPPTRRARTPHRSRPSTQRTQSRAQPSSCA